MEVGSDEGGSGRGVGCYVNRNKGDFAALHLHSGGGNKTVREETGEKGRGGEGR